MATGSTKSTRRPPTIWRRSAASIGLAALAFGGAFSVAARAAARESEAATAFPAMGQLVPVGRGHVHAHMQGQGRDLVLIHGASGNTRDFTFRLAGELARDFRVTAFDRPGLGWSTDLGDDGIDPAAQARALAQAARDLGIERPVVLGQSYGGAVALAWGLEAADILPPAALVLVSAAAMPWEGGLGLRYDFLSSRLGLATALPLAAAFVNDTIITREIEGIFAPEPVPEGYGTYIGAGLSLRRAVMRANLLQVAGLKPHLHRMALRYPDLSIPVEMVHGTADAIVPPQIHAHPLLRLLPDARLDMIEGAGHMPHHTRPDRVAAAILRATGRSS
ncbi:MAG: alpha/beta hydrolase [Paracoccaceae bacterium]